MTLDTNHEPNILVFPFLPLFTIPLPYLLQLKAGSSPIRSTLSTMSLSISTPMLQPAKPIALATEVPHLHPEGTNWAIFARCIERAMRHTCQWGYFDGSYAYPVPKDPNHPTDTEELAAQQWDYEDETAGYLMSQCLPDSVILDIGDFTTIWEQ
jgi:hypothetical protein